MKKLSRDEFEAIAKNLPLAQAVPAEEKLARVRSSGCGFAACDPMHLVLYRHRETGELWLRASGGIADVTLWYGPGSPALLDQPADAKSRQS